MSIFGTSLDLDAFKYVITATLSVAATLISQIVLGRHRVTSDADESRLKLFLTEHTNARNDMKQQIRGLRKQVATLTKESTDCVKESAKQQEELGVLRRDNLSLQVRVAELETLFRRITEQHIFHDDPKEGPDA